MKAHDGMRRKKSEAPYILHPMEAAVIVGTMTDDQNLIAAAALHDVVEDAKVWLGDKLANMRAIYRDFKAEGISMWQRFNQKEPDEQAWYYNDR